jgi:hypothetical protein
MRMALSPYVLYTLDAAVSRSVSLARLDFLARDRARIATITRYFGYPAELLDLVR